MCEKVEKSENVENALSSLPLPRRAAFRDAEQVPARSNDAARAVLSARSPKPWTLPPRGLAVFHGAGDTARLSHYFLPRLLLADKRVLFLDGANSADPRLLARLARERGVRFAEFSRRIQIARAFTCFQLTELVARVPRFLADFPAEVLIVTAFPDLYFDEDVRDWDARVAFEQALAGLRRWAGASDVAAVFNRQNNEAEGHGFSCAITPPHPTSGLPLPQRGKGVRDEGGLRAALTPAPLPQGEGGPALRDRVRSSGAAGLPIAVGVFSSASAFAPPPARRRFFERLCAAAAEVWEFSLGEDNRVKLLLTMPHTRVPQGLKPFAMGSGDSRTARLKSLCEKWAERRLSG